MREVPAGALDETFRDFLQRSASAMAVPRGGLPYLRRLSAGALGESVARDIFEDGVTSPLARLEGAPSDAVAALLEKEPPQLVAAVLARLEPSRAAEIISAMPLERQTTVIRYVGTMTELPAKVLEDVATALANELPTADASTLVSVDGISKAAALLNAGGREMSTAILQALATDDAKLASDVQQAMLTFEDLSKLDPKSMRELLRDVPTERLTLALKGTSQELMDAVFAGLSSRAAELLRDDLEMLGKIKKAEIDAARREIVETALRLEGEGRVDLGREAAE
jgi:flagellar motor switch protein FliG